jgi:hypothetical protein
MPSYSPIKMFGAYVSSASSSIGWGGQGGSMQLKLVEDEDATPPVLINLPPVGTPCYFKYDNFYFGGIFQRYTYAESVSGGRTYDIVIDSPSKLMDGVQLILEDFTGTTDHFVSNGNQNQHSSNISGMNLVYGDIENVYNLFGYQENLFYNGWFGGSNFNSSGMEVDRALIVLGSLANRASTHDLGGPINLGGHKFDLDVSEVLVEVQNIWSFSSDAYRVKGPSKSVNGLISEIAEAIQIDYFYDIRPAGGFSGLSDGGDSMASIPDDAVIKVRTVSKQQQPTAGAIKAYVQQEKLSGNVISYSIGEEYGDATTQKLVWGGRRTRYQAVNAQACQPIWGKIPNVPFGMPYKTQGLTANVMGSPSSIININLGNNFNNATYKASLFEIRMALGGKSSWEIYKTFETTAGVEPNGFNNLFTCPWTGQFDATKDVLQLMNVNAASAYDAVMTNKDAALKAYRKAQNEVAAKMYTAVSEVANNYYCQQFLVPLQGESLNRSQMEYRPPGDYEVIRAWEVSDAAFVQKPLAGDIAFRDGNGRQKSMTCWSKNASYDYSSLGSDYDEGLMDFAGGIVSTKGSPDKEMYWDGDHHWLAYKAGATVKTFDYITTPDWGLSVLSAYFFGLAIPPQFYFTSGFNGSLQFAIPPDNVIPAAFGVPQESTRYNYGPWVTLQGTYSPEGKAEVIADQSLRPETFGGYANLKVMGGIVATTGAGGMTVNESGFVEVVGKPQGAIGERFAASGPYCTNIDVGIDATGGVKTTYKFNTWTPNFGKMAKYNIDRISGIRKASWNFAQKIRDRVEKRPFPKYKFEKMDLDLAKRSKQVNMAALNFALRPAVNVNNAGLGNQGGGNRGNPNNANFGNL